MSNDSLVCIKIAFVFHLQLNEKNYIFIMGGCLPFLCAMVVASAAVLLRAYLTSLLTIQMLPNLQLAMCHNQK